MSRSRATPVCGPLLDAMPAVYCRRAFCARGSRIGGGADSDETCRGFRPAHGWGRGPARASACAGLSSTPSLGPATDADDVQFLC